MEVVSKIEMRKLGDVKPYVRNPRDNKKTVDLLCEIIPKVGFNVPIVIDRNGVIVKGHARYNAAIRLGMEEVPCVVTDADDEAIRLDRLADNKVSEFSEWLDEGLAHELDMLNIDFDLSELGFDVPDSDFADFEFDDGASEGDEERRARFLKMQQESSEPAVQFATEKRMQAAESKVRDVVHTEKVYKSVCEKCGHVQYVRQRDAIEVEV